MVLVDANALLDMTTRDEATHEHLLDEGVGLLVVAAEARAEDDRLLLREREVFRRVSERVDDDVMPGFSKL